MLFKADRRRAAQSLDVGRPRPAMTGPALTETELGDLVKSTVQAWDSWRDMVRFSHDERWFGRLAVSADYEIWVLTWLRGQRTGFHDHGGAVGAFGVALGELRESVVARGRARVRYRMASGHMVRTFDGQHVHDIANVSSAPAISVHAYSPPLSAMRRYEMTTAGLILARTDVARVDW